MTMTDQIQHIFDISDADSENLDILIIQKLFAETDHIKYFTDCFNKEQVAVETIEDSIVIKYFMNYIVIDMDGNAIKTTVDSVNESNIHFIESFFKYLKATNNNTIIKSFKDYYISIDYATRLPKLLQLFRSKFIRENVFIDLLKTGQDNESAGFFRLMTDSLETNWELNIEAVIPIIDLYVNNCESCTFLIDLIRKHLELNIAYTFIQPSSIKENKCASVKFIGFLNKVMLHVFAKYISLFPCPESLSSSGLFADIVSVTFDALKIAYVPLSKMYIQLEREMKYSNNKHNRVSKSMQKSIELQFDRITKIYKDVDNNTNILAFLDKVTAYGIFISDDVSHTVSAIIINSVYDFAIKPTPNIIEYVLKTIDGSHNTNKHEKYYGLTCLLILQECLGYGFFADLNLTATKMLTAIIAYTTSVDHFEWTHPETAHIMYQQLQNFIAYFCCKFDASDRLNGANLLFHKINSKMNTLITDMLEISQKYTEKYNAQISFLRNVIKEDGVEILKHFIKTFMCCIQALQKIISCNLVDVKSMELELILPFNSFVVAMLKYLSDGKNPIYDIFHLNMETGDLLKELFKLINLGCASENFTDAIKANISIVKEMVATVKLDTELQKSLHSYLGNLREDAPQDDDDLPDDFLDPLLATEIKNPVMIPKIDKIFDRCSIMSHLYVEETNPFTREKLTIKDFEEYNKQDHIRSKLCAFINQLNDYKKNK